MEQKSYSEIYTETIEELRKIKRIWLSKNATFKKEEMYKRNIELWQRLRVPHGIIPPRRKPMTKFGGDRDGQPFRIVI